MVGIIQPPRRQYIYINVVYTANWVIIYYRSHPLQEPEKLIDIILMITPAGSVPSNPRQYQLYNHVLIHFQRSWFLQLCSAKFHFEETKESTGVSLPFVFSIYCFLLPMIVSLQVPPSKKNNNTFFIGSQPKKVLDVFVTLPPN